MRLATQIRSDHAGQRLRDDEADRLVVMTSQQRPERRLDSSHRVLESLTLGRTDGLGIFDPLPVNLGVAPLDLVDLEALPQSLVQVAEFVKPLRDGRPGPCRRSRRCESRSHPGPQYKRRERLAVQCASQHRHHPRDFPVPALRKRDVENPLQAILLVVNRRAGTDQNQLAHSSLHSNAISGSAHIRLADRKNGSIGKTRFACQRTLVGASL